MTEARFQPRTETLDLDRLLALTGARLSGEGRRVAISGVAALDWAGPFDLTVADAADQREALAASHAGVCILTSELASSVPAGAVALVSDDPLAALARAARALFPASAAAEPLFGPGVAPGASVHPEARLEQDVAVDPGAVIGPRAEIGRGAVIGANAVVGADVRVGRDSRIGHGATVTDALVGDRVTIEAGVAVGGSAGAPALGRVILQDDVVVSANAAIARGGLGDTMIGEGARIGALAVVGAEAAVGRHCVVFPGARVADGETLPDFTVRALLQEAAEPLLTARRPPAHPKDMPA